EPQRSQRVPRPTLHSSDRQLALLRDLPDRQALEMREADHLPVLGGQALERGRDLPTEHGLLDRIAAAGGLEQRLVPRCERRPRGGAPAHVDDRVPGDLVEPRPHAAPPRVVAVGVAPGAREDLLHDLLSGPALPQRVEREPEQLAGIRAIQGAQRVPCRVVAKAFHELGITRHGHVGYGHIVAAVRPEYRSPPTKSVGVVTTPARTPPRNCARTRWA